MRSTFIPRNLQHGQQLCKRLRIFTIKDFDLSLSYQVFKLAVNHNHAPRTAFHLNHDAAERTGKRSALFKLFADVRFCNKRPLCVRPNRGRGRMVSQFRQTLHQHCSALAPRCPRHSLKHLSVIFYPKPFSPLSGHVSRSLHCNQPIRNWDASIFVPCLESPV